MRPKPTCPFPAESFDYRLSFTQAKHFRDCPWYGWLLYGEQRHHEEKSPVADAGSLAHEVARACAKHCYENGVVSPAGALPTLFAEAVLREKPSAEVERMALNHMTEFVSDHEFRLERGQTWYAEEEAWWRIDTPSGLRLAVLSYIDHARVLGNTGWLQDYKFSRRVMSKDDFKDDLQLPVYAWALKYRHRNLTTIVGNMDFVLAHFQHERSITVEDMDRAFQWLSGTADMIHTGRKAVAGGKKPEVAFPARPGRACQPFEGYVCPMIHLCTFKQQSEGFAVTTPAEARTMLADVLHGEAEVKAKKAAVVAWSETNDPPVVGGKTISFTLTDRHSADIEKVVAWLTEQGYDWRSCFKFDSSAAQNANILTALIDAGAVVRETHSTARIVNCK